MRLQHQKFIVHDDAILCKPQLRSFHEPRRPLRSWNVHPICRERVASRSHLQNHRLCEEAQYPFCCAKYWTRVSGLPLNLRVHFNIFHSYMGKSTGANALAIWTHFLQKTTWIEDFVSPAYRGVAVKAQAGVTAQVLYEQADKRGYAVVGGECPVGTENFQSHIMSIWPNRLSEWPEDIPKVAGTPCLRPCTGWQQTRPYRSR